MTLSTNLVAKQEVRCLALIVQLFQCRVAIELQGKYHLVWVICYH